MRRFEALAAMIVIALFSLTLCASASAVAPTVLKTTLSKVKITSATLEADVNPQGKATLYHFEYGLADCATSPCVSTPEVSAGNKTEPIRVKEPVVGLTSGTTYHFRVVAKNGKNGDEVTKGPDRAFTTHVEEQVFALCANDLFREDQPSDALPDCRAYEQASPLDKNGLDSLGSVPTVKAAADGGGVGFGAANGLPGGKGTQETPLYLATRDGGGWSTQGMLPPESTGQEAYVLGWSADFTQVFSQAKRLSTSTMTFLSMSSADGSLANVAPYTKNAEYFYVGSSADDSEVFFEAIGPTTLLPDAAPGRPNLYVWDRNANTLKLAGVLNDGNAPASGAFAGPYDWAEGTDEATVERGGSHREYYVQDDHAISADGSQIFFTEGASGRLLVRTNPSAEQSPLSEGKCTNPALACTIEVSASQKKNGKGLAGTDSAGKRPAAFVGASADGSVALLTSSEKLTNDANTGPEPEPPAIARANIDGSGKDLGFILGDASGVDVDGAHIYWANPKAGTIGRADLDGDNVDPDFIAGAGIPEDVAVNAEHIYWTNTGELNGQGEPQEGEGTIGRADIDGDSGSVNVKFIEDATKPQAIAINAVHVYWTNSALTEFSPATIGRANLNGAGVNQELLKVSNGKQLTGLAVDAAHIYMLDTNTGGFRRIGRANLDGSEYETTFIFLDKTDSYAVAVDSLYVYWTSSSSIGRANLDGTSPNFEFIKEANHPKGLAIDASHIYWSANQGAEPNPGNDLYRYEAATGKLSDLAPDHTHTNGTDARGVLGASEDGSHVYFVANGVPDGVMNTPNERGESAVLGNCAGGDVESETGTCNLYLAHEGAITFITRLQAGGGGGLSDAANWAPTRRVFANSIFNFQRTARVTPDGRTLLFRSQRQLSDYDNESRAVLYRYRFGEGGPICVSCDPTGAPLGGAPTHGIFTPVGATAPPAATLTRSLSDSGDRVFFESTDALLPADTNGDVDCPLVGSITQSFPACQDVYEWEASGSGSCESTAQNGGCLYLLSSGKSTFPSFLADASASGEDVFIFTREQLVRGDQDLLIDVYDARVGGGLESQNLGPPVPCEGLDACHGPASTPTALPSPGTSSFFGPGNPKGRAGKKGQKRHGKKGQKRHGKRHHKKRHHRGTKVVRRAHR